MGQQVIEHEVTTSAPAKAIFALLADGSTWPDWSPIESFELVTPGDGTPEGVGAIRVFHTGKTHSRERVVTAKPDQIFSYELISGLAIRDYKAVVTLLPAGGGTTVKWRSTFRPKIPGTGWIYQRQLGLFIGRTVNGLVAYAESAQSAQF
jgi:Polyketide cyclase / dehydrase and lipid transport